MVARVALVALASAACTGKPRTDDAAPRAPAAADAHVARTAEAGPRDARDTAAAEAGARDARDARDAPLASAPGAAPATGELQVRVEWPRVPAVARSSPGRTPCGTPRTPAVAPTTTWGVPDVLVVVDGAPPPASPRVAHVTLADCALTPRVAAGDSLVVTSAVDRPARVVLRKRGTLARFGEGEPVPILLPIAGHAVAASLAAGAIYSIETETPDPGAAEVAFVAALPAQVTDAAGQVLLPDLAPGAHAVTAWLPPRAGQPARSGHGQATVVAGELAELTISLAP